MEGFAEEYFEGPPGEELPDLEDQESDSEYEPLTDEEIHNVVKGFLKTSKYGEDQFDSVITNSLTYYFGDPRGDEISGRSSFVSTDVADMIEATLAQLSPMLLNKNIANFKAYDIGDEEQARTESRFCNNQIMVEGNGYSVFTSAIKSSFLQRTASVFFSIDTSETMTEESYEQINPFDLSQILMPRKEGEQVVIVKQEGEGMFMDVTIKRINQSRRLIMEPILPRNILWVNSSENEDIDNLTFVARRRYVLRGDLIIEGFDPNIVDKVPACSTNLSSDDRINHSYRRNLIDTNAADQKAAEVVEIYYCYPMMDLYGAGIVERREIILAGPDGEYMLTNKPADIVPIAIGTPFPMPGDIEGLGMYDKLKSVQDGKTSSMRQWLDNQNANNNRRLAVNVRGIEDADSVYESKPAGVIKCKMPPSEVLMPIPVDDIGQSCMTLLDYFDRITAHRAGAALDMQTQQQSIEGDSAHGIERQMSAKELMAAFIARNLSESLIKRSFLIVHHLLRTQVQGVLSTKFGDVWQTTDTSKWPARSCVIINTGDTPARKKEKYGILTQILGTQMTLKEQGSTLVDDLCLYNTLAEMADVGLDDIPDKYFINPNSERGKQAAQQQQQITQQQMEEQKMLQQLQVKAQTDIAQAELIKSQAAVQKNRMQLYIDQLKQQLEELKAASEEGKEIADLQFRYSQLYTQMAVKLAEIEQKGEQQDTNVQQNRKVLASGQ